MSRESFSLVHPTTQWDVARMNTVKYELTAEIRLTVALMEDIPMTNKGDHERNNAR